MIPKNKSWVVALALVVWSALLLAACGGTSTEVPVIEVLATEFEFSPTEIEVSAGDFTITINDEGTLEHDFIIEGSEDQGSALAQPGETAQNTFTLEAGTYTFYCAIVGHREAGMEGTITVTE